MTVFHKRVWLFASLCWVCLASASPVHRGWIVRRDVDPPTTEAALSETEPTVEEVPIAVQDQKETTNQPKIYSLNVESDIQLRYATTRVTSRVANPANVAQEATFHLVLPETAFISSFLMDINGKIYKARIKEKEKAQEEYDSAVSAGQTAAQVSTNARDANQFTVSVNIESGGKIFFMLTYEELLTRRRGLYEQSIHVNPGAVVPKLAIRVNIYEVLPITSVFVPEMRINDIHKEDDSKNEEAMITRLNETAVTIVYEPTEAQQTKTTKDGLQGQFVIQYDVDRSSTENKGGEIHVVDGYFVHFFAPSTLPALPKHVVFVLDTSGSMHGIRLEQTKQAMTSILKQLRSNDVFSVIEFSTDVKEWDLTNAYEPPEKPYSWIDQEEAVTEPTTPEPGALPSFGPFDDLFAYPVTNDSIKRAIEFVDLMKAMGSTNINGALLTALNNTQSVQSRIRLTPLIIFLTDGEATVGVTRNEDILANLRKANADGVVSIFSLAFGTGADFDFLTKVSDQNKGFARKIYEASDATLQLKGFFDEVGSPLLSNVRFVYGTDKVSEVTTTRVANYFKGSEFVVTGRLEEQQDLIGTINATSAQGRFTQEFRYDVIDSDDLLPALGEPKSPSGPKKSTIKPSAPVSLEKIWAYLTIQELLKERNLGSKDSSNATSKALLLSLKYDFVTPLTSLLVIKPNETDATTADVRPADENGISGINTYRPQSFLAPPAFAINAFAPLKRPAAFLSTTTSYDFYLVNQAHPIGEPEHESCCFQLAESATEWVDAVTESATEVEVILPQLKWINQFEHNTTHAQIPTSTGMLELSWTDDLPDKDYEACGAQNSTTAVAGFCKSIWKCAILSRELERFDYSSACVIDNRHVGVCCLSPVRSSEAV